MVTKDKLNLSRKLVARFTDFIPLGLMIGQLWFGINLMLLIWRASSELEPYLKEPRILVLKSGIISLSILGTLIILVIVGFSIPRRLTGEEGEGLNYQNLLVLGGFSSLAGIILLTLSYLDLFPIYRSDSDVYLDNPRVIAGGSHWCIFQDNRLRYLSKLNCYDLLRSRYGYRLKFDLSPFTGFKIYNLLLGVSYEYLPSRVRCRYSWESEYGLKLFPSDFGRVLRRLLGRKRASILSAMIWGSRVISPKLKLKFKRSGLYHLLVVSGGNVLLIAFITYIALVTFLGPDMARFIALVNTFLYVILAGADYPLIRGFIMSAILLLSSGWRVNSYRALLWVWAIITLLDPLASLSWSLIMSFMAVESLVVLYPLLMNFIGEYLDGLTEQWSALVKWILAVPLATITVWFALSPISVLLFGSVSLLAPLSNLLAFPISDAIITLGLILSLLVYLNLYTVASIIANLLKILLSWLIGIADLFSHFYVELSLNFEPSVLQALAYLWVILFSLSCFYISFQVDRVPYISYDLEP